MASQLDGFHALPLHKEDRDRLFEIHKFHMRFHMRIAEGTGCDELCQAVEKNQVLVSTGSTTRLSAMSNRLPAGIWSCRALLSGDPIVADAAMRRHTRYRMDEVLQQMEPYFGFSETRLNAFPKRPRRTSKSTTVA